MFIILIIVANIVFLLFVVPKLDTIIRKIIRGELFLSVIEFFAISFLLLTTTFLIIYIVYLVFNS